MRGVHVVLLIRLDQDDLFQGLPYILTLQLVTKGDFVLQTLFLAIGLSLAF